MNDITRYDLFLAAATNAILIVHGREMNIDEITEYAEDVACSLLISAHKQKNNPLVHDSIAGDAVRVDDISERLKALHDMK